AALQDAAAAEHLPDVVGERANVETGARHDAETEEGRVFARVEVRGPRSEVRRPMFDIRWPMADGRWVEKFELAHRDLDRFQIHGLALARLFIRANAADLLRGVGR